MDVETELKTAAEVRLQKGEDRSAFLKRLANEAFKLEDQAWEDLSDGAQRWINLAVTASDAKKEIPEPNSDGGISKVARKAAGDEHDQAWKSEREAREEEEKEVKVKARGPNKKQATAKEKKAVIAVAKKAKAKPKAKPQAAKPQANGERRRGPTARVMIRQFVAKNPKITKEALIAKVRASIPSEDELRTGSIITWRYDMIQIMRILDDYGLLKISMPR